jgi:tetratricopeptide (TPR) repeat protein
MNNEVVDPACRTESTSACQPVGFKRNSGKVFLGVACITLVVIFGILLLQFASPDPEQSLAQGRRLMNRKPEEATRLLQQVSEASVALGSEARELLCLIQVRSRNREEAIHQFGALDLQQCSITFLSEFGRFAVQADAENEAILALNEIAIRKSDEQISALETLSQIYRNRHDDTLLLDCLNKLADISPEQPERWQRIVAFLDSRQMTTNSVDVLKAALKAGLSRRDEIEFRHQLINRLISLGQIQEAWLALESLPASESSSPRADRHRAALHRMEGKPAMAIAALEKSDDLTSVQPGVAWLRGQIRFDLKQFEAAKSDLLIVVEADPFDLTVHLKLADIFKALNDQKSADKHRAIAENMRQKRQRINRLREKFRQNPDPAIRQELAELHAQLNDVKGAEFWQQAP